MPGLSDLLHLSGSALNAYQSQISVYGQNISNVETDGYSRRTQGLEAMVTADGTSLGVRNGEVTRSFDAMSASVLLQEDAGLSYQTETASLLGQLEVLSGTSTGGLYSALQEFEDAWGDVAANPEDLAVRMVLLQKAASLTAEFNQLDTCYNDFSEMIVGTASSGTGLISETVAEVNVATTRLQDLNQRIMTADVGGRGVPELRDERDRLARQLSQIAGVSVSPDYRVTLGGQELVSSDGSARQEVTQTYPATVSVGGVDITALVSGGELAARLNAYSSVQDLQGSLDLLMQNLMTEMNAVVDTAYNLNGESPAEAGYAFFTGTSAADFAVDTALFDPSSPLSAHPELVAAAATRASAGPPPIPNSGDNAAALAAFDMLASPIAALGSRSVSQYWSNVESVLATAVAEANDQAETAEVIVGMLEERVQSTAGVNLDEELINLMAAQRAYDACARVFSTANKLLDTLMSIV